METAWRAELLIRALYRAIEETANGEKEEAAALPPPSNELRYRAPKPTPLANDTIKQAIKLCKGTDSWNHPFFGPIETWNTSMVTNMEGLFYGCDNFNGDLSLWDVSNVTNMKNMFFGCKNFTSDLSRWDVRKVTTMEGMFNGCVKFNSDLSRWNVSVSGKFYVTSRPGYMPFFTDNYKYKLATVDEFNNPTMRPEEIDRIWEKLYRSIVRMCLLRYTGRGSDGEDQYDTIVDGRNVVRAIGEETARYVDPAEEARDKDRLKVVLEERWKGWNTPISGPTLYLAMTNPNPTR